MSRLADLLTIPVILAWLMWRVGLWIVRACAVVLCSLIVLPAIPLALIAGLGRRVAQTARAGMGSEERIIASRAIAIGDALKRNPGASPEWIARQVGG